MPRNSRPETESNAMNTTFDGEPSFTEASVEELATTEADAGRIREELADAYKRASGRGSHSNDCATSVAPAEMPGPCDCESRFESKPMTVRLAQNADGEYWLQIDTPSGQRAGINLGTHAPDRIVGRVLAEAAAGSPTYVRADKTQAEDSGAVAR